MIDLSTASVSKVIVHSIGNKAREEGYTFSPKEAERTPTLDALLIKSYLEQVVDVRRFMSCITNPIWR